MKSLEIKKTKRDNLVISEDYDFNPKYPYPVLLYTPDMDNTNEHYHISLTKSEARKLRDWLKAFLKD